MTELRIFQITTTNFVSFFLNDNMVDISTSILEKEKTKTEMNKKKNVIHDPVDSFD